MKSISILILAFILTGCSGGGSDAAATDPGTITLTATLNLQCDLNAIYSPVTPPITSAGTGTPTTTVIALHGKSGSPLNGVISTLATDLNAKGYNIIRPYMPWSSLVWSGTLCDGISYINELIVAEKAIGNSVILLGHSLGGVVVLSYTALANTTKPDGLTVMAPGHYVPNSSGLNTKHAASILEAKNKIAAGQGDVLETFQTSDYDISATPNVYLTFHGIDQLTDQFSDIKAGISLISVPTLWLPGSSDPLTGTTKSLGIIDTVSANSFFTYKEIVGDHYTLVDNVTDVLDPWFKGL